MLNYACKEMKVCKVFDFDGAIQSGEEKMNVMGRWKKVCHGDRMWYLRFFD